MFHIQYGPQHHSLPSGELMLVGRGEHCDIQLHDPSASRVHCRLLSHDGKVMLTDAGSRWGTFVNGQRVDNCELRPGDEIRIGETVLRLSAEGEPRATTLARQSQLKRFGLDHAGSIKSDEPPPPQAAPVVSAAPEAPLVRKRLKAAEFQGASFLDFHIEELLRRTESGLLFRAVRVRESVALKLLHPEMLAKESARQRFHRAVHTVLNLHHPGLVTLYDGGIHRGIPYSVSEFIQGESVAEMIPRIGVAGMLDWRTTLRIGRDLASVLQFLEEKGIIHRNITPRNILIRKSDGTALLSDLLLSKSLDTDEPTVTQAGETVGELPYLSPEQVGSGQPVDHRSDIYQLGATLYALLTGRPPFEGRGQAEIIQQILTDSPTPPTRYHLAIPPQLEGTVKTMLEKRPSDRFATAADLVRALDRVQKYVAME